MRGRAAQSAAHDSVYLRNMLSRPTLDRGAACRRYVNPDLSPRHHGEEQLLIYAAADGAGPVNDVGGGDGGGRPVGIDPNVSGCGADADDGGAGWDGVANVSGCSHVSGVDPGRGAVDPLRRLIVPDRG